MNKRNTPRRAGTLTADEQRTLDQFTANNARKAKVNATNEETQADGLTPDQRRILEENTRLVATKGKGRNPKDAGDHVALAVALRKLRKDEAERL